MSVEDTHESRRQFLQKLAVAGLSLPLAGACARKPKRSATDLVTLNKSGVQVSRLGMGTGSNGGKAQRELGQADFTRMIRYGIERGITFIDTADNYEGMHEMVGQAIKGLDREKIQIQCKISPFKYEDPLKELDRFRKEVASDYFDSFLIHCVTNSSWPQDTARLQDLLGEAKHKGWIRSHGVSIHGLEPLAAASQGHTWPDICLVRVNHNGHHMDGPTGKWREPGERDAALPRIQALHDQGMGIIGMKLIGNGDFTDAAVRKASVEFVMRLDYVDAVIIGFKSPQEIDEAMANVQAGLNG